MKFICIKLVFTLLCFVAIENKIKADPDKPFKQAISVKYNLHAELTGAELTKLVIDVNDVVYVLSNKGLLRVNDRFLIKDLRFTPLSKKQPIDICIQESQGNLYYLFEDKLLTNAHAGVPYAILPKNKYNKIAVANDGSILLAGKNCIGFVKNNQLTTLNDFPEEQFSHVYIHNSVFYVLGKEQLYKFQNNQLVSFYKSKAIQAITFEQNNIIIGTENGYYGIDNISGRQTIPLQTKLPELNINCLLFDGISLWAGSSAGAFMKQVDNSYRYYASKRWLNENQVKDISVDSKGDIYCLSNTALNKIEFKSQTLAEKASYFQDKIRQRHIRYGLISEVFFQKPGDLSTAQMMDTDNDGLWSSFYLGSQAFRYAVTKETVAKKYAWETFEAYERLISINPLKGFPSRTFERIEYRNSDPEAWRKSQDPEWEWKGTTSSDEFVGHIFAAAVMSEFVAKTPNEKKRVANFIDKILTHIIDNNYYFVDADGKPTRWGRWNPEYINWYPESISDRKLGSTTIIAGLQLGYALTGKQLYKKEAYRLMKEHGYLKNILIDCEKIKVTPGYTFMGYSMGHGWNHSDDEMSFLTYWVLYHTAFTDTLKKQYAGAIVNHWKNELPERDAVWNLITKGTAGVYDKESTFWFLKEFPMDLVRWSVVNSNRKDLVLLPENLRGQTTNKLLPYGEQPMHRHNTNPFYLDSKDGGTAELAGDEFLLPYWMARYLGVLK